MVSLHSVAGVWGACPQAFRCKSMFARMRNSFTSIDLSAVDLSSCRPVTCNMAIYGVCILLRGSRGLTPQAFRCESKRTPLNLTYILPYDCPCFARMHNFFTSFDLSTVDQSTCQPVDLSPVTWLYMEFAFCCGGLGCLSPGIPW